MMSMQNLWGFCLSSLQKNAPIESRVVRGLNHSSKLSVDNIRCKQQPRVGPVAPRVCSAGDDGWNFRRVASTPHQGRGFRRHPREYAQLNGSSARPTNFTKAAEEPPPLIQRSPMHESNRLRQLIHKPWQAHHPKMLAELQSKHQTELPSTAARSSVVTRSDSEGNQRLDR